MRFTKRFNIRTKLTIKLQKFVCNLNINVHQYITHNNTYLCTCIPSTTIKPLVQNVFYLQPRGVSIITVQAPTELKPQYIYGFSTSDDLPLGLIP